MPTLVSALQLPTAIPLDYLIHIAPSPARLACSAVNDERERAVSYKVYKVEDEVVLCLLWPVLILPYTYEQVCAHTQTKKTKLNHSLILCPPKAFFLLVGVVTVLKNFKVRLTFQLMFSSAKSWIEGDQL